MQKSGERTGSAGTGSLRSTAWIEPAAGVCADEGSALRAALRTTNAPEGRTGD